MVEGRIIVLDQWPCWVRPAVPRLVLAVDLPPSIVPVVDLIDNGGFGRVGVAGDVFDAAEVVVGQVPMAKTESFTFCPLSSFVKFTTLAESRPAAS